MSLRLSLGSIGFIFLR